ncbi:MAG TPA: hypothetical protein VH328_08165 [Burkholderiaceae bacterium]|nr:hypothetical protein [Burkholderiaceae bacterium]
MQPFGGSIKYNTDVGIDHLIKAFETEGPGKRLHYSVARGLHTRTALKNAVTSNSRLRDMRGRAEGEVKIALERSFGKKIADRVLADADIQGAIRQHGGITLDLLKGMKGSGESAVLAKSKATHPATSARAKRDAIHNELLNAIKINHTTRIGQCVANNDDFRAMSKQGETLNLEDSSVARKFQSNLTKLAKSLTTKVLATDALNREKARIEHTFGARIAEAVFSDHRVRSAVSKAPPPEMRGNFPFFESHEIPAFQKAANYLQENFGREELESLAGMVKADPRFAGKSEDEVVVALFSAKLEQRDGASDSSLVKAARASLERKMPARTAAPPARTDSESSLV